ncbi:MAG: ribokinase [Rhodospirillales bacterium]|nr:ribokinase [Rhodospirillales bacterium]
MIIVFGSNVLDQFFQLADLPPKDTAIHLETHHEAPGGKGANQAIAAARAGADVKFYGALGQGGHGRQLFKNLAAHEVDVSGIEFLDMPSGMAVIFVDETDGTHRVVVSHGANLKARESTIPDKELNNDTTVLVQAELPLVETESLVRRAKSKGARTIMNLAPANPLSEDALRHLDFLIMNEHEADGLGETLGLDTKDKFAFARSLHDKFGTTVIITLGPDGTIACTDEGLLSVPALKVKPIDTIGAGDAFCGYFAAALDQGLSLDEALRRASVAGSLACTRIGAQSALPPAKDVDMYAADISIEKAA